MKSKLPLGKFGKKAEDEEDDLIEDSENTEDVAMGRKSKVTSASDKTSVTDVADVSNISTDELEEEEGPVSLVDKIKAKFSSKKSASEKKIAAKAVDPKRKVIIYVAVLALLTLLLWDEIFPPDTTDTPIDPAAIPALKKGYTKKPKVVAEKPIEPAKEPVTEVSSTEPTPAPVEATSTPEALNTTVPAIEESSVKVEAAPKIEETISAETVESLPIETTPAPKSDEVVTETPVGTESVDSIDGQIKESSDENMTEKILEDLEKQAQTGNAQEIKIREYVSPPDYEFRGRGLVYNCVGKHWACVDAPSFKTCQNNAEGNKYLKKKVECYPMNVYQNQKGCEIVQNRMVSASTKTNFCSGN